MTGLDRWDAVEPPTAPAADAAPLDRWDAVNPAASASVKPTKDALGSDTQNFLAGAGKAVFDLARGGKQILDVPARWLEEKFPGVSKWAEDNLGTPSAASSANQTNAEVTESRKIDAPLMGTKAGIAGDVAGNIAATMVPLAAIAKTGSVAARVLLNPTTYKAAGAAGAIQGALQPVTDDESRTLNTITGTAAGVGGNAAVNLVGRLAQPVAALASAAHDKAVRVLSDAGIPLDAAQRTGSTFLNKLRSSFSDNPFTAGPQADFMAGQRALYNGAVLKTMGVDGATSATPEVMNGAAQRIDGVFKDVLDRNSVAVNDSVLARVGQIQKAAVEEEKKPVANIANRFIDAVQEDGTVPGQAAYNIKKDLDRLASSGDSTLAYHARQLRSTVMDSIHASLNDEDRAAFDQARGQFANMKKIEGVIDDAGDVSAPKLANVFRQKRNRAISIYGKGPQDLYDLAQAGSMLLPDRNPNSGSVGRAVMQLALPVVAGGAEGYRSYTGSDAESAITRGMMTAGAVAAGPRAAQYLINSPATASYLQSGIRGSMTPLRDLLLLPQTNAAIGGAARRLPESTRITKAESARP